MIIYKFQLKIMKEYNFPKNSQTWSKVKGYTTFLKYDVDLSEKFNFYTIRKHLMSTLRICNKI